MVVPVGWWPWMGFGHRPVVPGGPWLTLPPQDEDGHTLLDEDIAAEADTFMFEGRTCPSCPSPPCASRRACGCTLLSLPCPSAALRTSPCVTAVSSPRRDTARPPPHRKPGLILQAEDGIWLLLEPLVGVA
ncbi:uncharacterized protein LOC130266154 isoform X3 [Oenanthe melanoleuca]|uniref:uncharacterized protein LOC130266154 isoform X3 n=1 Tax=Oenanthe melanoleuca TaxID=2939378 RepID=UPI0024C1F975|nr:uncharacterized protein LOC130266154 isoform X3 [Oenanthe melanoleuca]